MRIKSTNDTRYLGIGRDTITLMCIVLNEHNGELVFEVINGAWDGKLINDKMTVLATGHIIDNMHILYYGQLPTEVARDYNEAIAFMNNYLETSLIPRWFTKRIFHISRIIVTAQDKIVGAFSGLIAGWKNPNQIYNMLDDDDDIPF